MQPRHDRPTFARCDSSTPTAADRPSASIGLDDTLLSLPVGSPVGELAISTPKRIIRAGLIVGGYHLIECIGMGGMGVVYLGAHVATGHEAAVKMVHRWRLADGETIPRFMAEARAAARISHPGVVKVLDYGPFDGGAYLAMEYLRGETLQERIARGERPPLGWILDICVQIGATLAATHEAGVIHRDLKPANLFLVPDPVGRVPESVKVLDFGIAKLTSAPASSLTRRDDIIGTPHYMAPEQFIDPGAVGPRCDVYSFGCVLFQLATGRLPFGGSALATVFAHLTSLPPPPRSLDPMIPRALESLILRMLAKSPDLRPRGMAEVVCALTEIRRAGSPADEERGGSLLRRPFRPQAPRAARSGRRAVLQTGMAARSPTLRSQR